MKKHALALLLVGMVAFGCQKDKDDDKGNRTELITKSSWKYDAAYLGTTSTPLPAGYIEDCMKDNIITLRSDGSGTLDEGGSKCDPDDEQTTTITWEFRENETVLYTPTEIAPGVSGEIKINSLTSTELQVQKSVPTPFGNQTIIIDLKH